MNKEEKHFNKCPICGRPTHKESKHCIFHASAEEKTEEEFKGALKEYIDKIKKDDSDYDFNGFIFIGDIDFGMDFGIDVVCNSSFQEVEFLYGNISFENMKFRKDPKFINAKILSGDVNFKNVKFEEKTSFLGLLFNGIVDFSGAFFSKEVKFKGTNFEGGSTSFREVVFGGDVFFEGNIFQNDIDFGNAGFKENFSFGYNKFNGSEINFNCADINKNFDIALTEKKHISLNFESITTYFAFADIKLIVKNGGILFRNTFLEKISLCFEIYNDSYIDFEGARIKDTMFRRDHIEGHIIQENKKSYDKAKEIYITLKNNFHSIGRYDDESWAYIKERNMEKLSYSFANSEENNTYRFVSNMKNILDRFILKVKFFIKWLFSKKFLNWFKLSISSFIYGYGENPWYVIRFALIIIFLFAILLYFSGIVNSDRTNLIIEFIKKSQGDEYTLKYLGPILGSILDCLYFSVVTFTTLGYGDFQPAVGLSRIFVSLESIIGAITMALFVYTFARRTGGR